VALGIRNIIKNKDIIKIIPIIFESRADEDISSPPITNQIANQIIITMILMIHSKKLFRR
jgi:hypothetical protein